MQLFYERRIIEDVCNNTYPIWEVYRIDNKMNNHIQIRVYDNEEDFNRDKKKNFIIYKKYTNKGTE